jgi:3,4-dihydroxy 2-butanone 4-phosphate synthase / GTP cyclohydrolase II
MNALRRDVPKGALSILIDKDAIAGRGRGIIFMSAREIDADEVNIMARHGRGVVSAALKAERALMLGLVPMRQSPRRSNAPHFVASVEARACAETGISAAERALTLRVLAEPGSVEEDLVSPGHIMPAIISDQIGVDLGLETIAFRYAERSNDSLAVAWCDILGDDGEVGDWEYCAELAKSLDMPLYVRRGDSAIADSVLAASSTAPSIVVNEGGLDRGQFA